VTDAADRDDIQPAVHLDDPIEALLDGAVVYAAGQAPPAPDVAPDLDLPTDLPAHHAREAFEARVSPVYWAAAVVWNLPGGLGGWWLLRKTHPRTARRLLLVGIVSFVIIAAVVVAVVLADRSMNPRYIYLSK